MKKQRTATAVVTLTLEIKVDGSWGDNCTIGQINDQASQEAIGFIRQNCQAKVVRDRLKIVGTPKVKSVMVEDTP